MGLGLEECTSSNLVDLWLTLSVVFDLQRRSPTCAVCRTKLSRKAPMIPNFAMDSTVEKHIQALVASGASEWAEGGKKLLELEARKTYVLYTPEIRSSANFRFLFV